MNKDSVNHKELIIKSKVPYYQEIESNVIKVNNNNIRLRREAKACYTCKDLKGGSTYEHCSFSSQPQASIKVEYWKELPSSIRFRRSNAKSDSIEDKSTSTETTSTDIRDKTVNEPYEFREEFFLPQASHRFPVDYDKSDLCEKVFRDSMVCTVCKDPKTSGKYEQCSYIAEPNEKAYAYTKSSSFGKPTKTNKSSSHKKRNYNKPASAYESIGSSEYRDDELSEYNPNQVSKEATGSSECKQV